MFSTLQRIPIPLLLILATTLEVSGDALVRLGIYQYVGPIRVACFLAGAALLFGYGSVLNTAPVDFARIVGLYIALPGLPVVLGGALIITGGVITTFWHAAA